MCVTLSWKTAMSDRSSLSQEAKDAQLELMNAKVIDEVRILTPLHTTQSHTATDSQISP